MAHLVDCLQGKQNRFVKSCSEFKTKQNKNGKAQERYVQETASAASK